MLCQCFKSAPRLTRTDSDERNLEMKNLSRKFYLLRWCFLIGISLISNTFAETAGADKAEAERPNVIFMLVDNVGWGDIGIYGGGILRGAPTPRLDELAEEGLHLLNFNTEPFCVPTRSTLMSGRLSVRTGTSDITKHVALPESEITLADLLSGAGYDTAIFGKWHLGNRTGLYPTDRGFDEWYGIPESSHTAMFDTNFQYDPELASVQMVMSSQKGRKPVEVKAYDLNARREIDGELVNKAITFMTRSVKKGKPFFLYLPFTQTHMPTLPHPDFSGKTGNGDYADTLAEMDFRAGQILDAIDDLKIRANTVVIWASDNGPSAESPHGTAGYWRGRVGQALEGSIRTPFIMRWPDKIKPGGVNNEIVHVADMMPTLARIAGYQVPADRVIDGIDQLDFLLGKQEHSNRDGFPIFGGNGRLWAYKWKNWKLHYVSYNQDDWKVAQYVRPDSTVPGLYNLLIDPKEEHSVSPEYFWVGGVIDKKMKEFSASLNN